MQVPSPLRSAWPEEVLALLPDWDHTRPILAGMRGSYAHGTVIKEGPYATDDRDYWMVTAHSPSFYCGLYTHPQCSRDLREDDHHAFSDDGEYDLLVYDLPKFTNLLRKGNFTTHNWLHCPSLVRNYMSEDGGRILVDNRHEWLTQQVFRAFAGFANNQTERMMEGPTEKGYMGAKRRELFKKHGYDCKMAANAWRVYWVGANLHRTGNYVVNLPPSPRDTVVAFKKGRYGVDEALTLLRSAREDFEQARAESSLPLRFNMEQAHNMTAHIVEEEYTFLGAVDFWGSLT